MKTKLLLFFFTIASGLNAQVLDTSFDSDGIRTDQFSNTPTQDICYGACMQSDGKILFAGRSDNQESLTTNGFITRLNPDGTFDTSFNNYGFTFSNLSLFEYITTQSDNKILVSSRNYIRRYNSNGSLDTSFINPILNNTFNTKTLKLQNDGKILIAGYESNGTNNDFSIYRLNTDGTFDNTFDIDGKATFNIFGADECYDITILNDGKIILAGQTKASAIYDIALLKLNSNGSLDTTFDTDGILTYSFGSNTYTRSIYIQVDGKILILASSSVLRFNSNGTFDSTFGTNGIFNLPITIINSIGTTSTSINLYKPKVICLNDNKILISCTSNNDFKLLKLNSNGSIDTTFGFNGIATSNDQNDYSNFLFVTLDNKFITGGFINNSFTNQYSIKLILFNENGILNSQITKNLKTSIDKIRHITEINQSYGVINNSEEYTKFSSLGQINISPCVNFNQSDKIYKITNSENSIYASYTSSMNSSPTLLKFDFNGNLDSTFGINGKTNLSTTPINHFGFIDDINYVNNNLYVGFDFLPNGSDSSISFGLCKLNNNGSIDTTFGNNGYFTTRFNHFNNLASEYCSDIDIQSDGKIIMTGWVTNGILSQGTQTNWVLGITRVNSDGTLDTTFGTNGKVINSTENKYFPTELIILPDNKFLVNIAKNIGIAITKYNSDGSLDITFGNNGIINISDNFNEMLLQNDGKIILVGTKNNQIASSRYLANGTLDTTWGVNGYLTTSIGFYSQANTAIFTSDNKLLIGGTSFDGTRELATLVKYTDVMLGNINFEETKNSILVYPNPIVSDATFEFSLNEEENISIDILDINGKIVQTIMNNEKKSSGNHSLNISLNNNISSGNYFIRFTSNKGSKSVQIIKK